MTRKDFQKIIDSAEPEHQPWLETVIDDIFSENNYVAVNAKRMLGTYLGIIGNNKTAKGRKVQVEFSDTK